jgi:hypothetical protein
MQQIKKKQRSWQKAVGDSVLKTLFPREEGRITGD